MIFDRDERIYWEDKVIAYLHDSPDKMFFIPGHEERAAELIESLGLQKPNFEKYRQADAIAAGFERGFLPPYSKDENKNGAVSMLVSPYLTHPISHTDPLLLRFPDDFPKTRDEKIAKASADTVNAALIEFMHKALEAEPVLSRTVDEPPYAKRLFFYLHLALRFRLSSENICGLGAFWHRIPADTRIPDHSIWQHNALTSALSSCSDIGKGLEDVALMSYSITPVQSYINSARRLRDFWTGSIILSWLAFEGIVWVMENLGPDHILYPSLIDQPLVRLYLTKTYGIDDAGTMKDPGNRNAIASFPNKFVFLIPYQYAQEIAEAIEAHIHKQWMELSDSSCSILIETLRNSIDEESMRNLRMLFKRQTETFWHYDWSAVRLLKKDDERTIKDLLPESRYASSFATLEEFSRLDSNRNSPLSGMGLLYGPTHTLAQAALAASKGVRYNERKEEPGEKCVQCGEFEVLHTTPYQPGMKARDYAEGIKSFWKDLSAHWPNTLDFEEDDTSAEHLCANCFIKRVAYRVLENKNEHILHEVCKGLSGFPSTTEIALHSWFIRQGISNEKERREQAQKIHMEDENIDSRTIKDRYYAILYMDGDRMGRLVGGETIGSEWKSVLQKTLIDRMTSKDFARDYRDCWNSIFSKHPKRLLTPAIHAAISESLGDFALYGVAPTIEKYEGKLIYAGGDDVCAFLPVEHAIKAAFEIRDYYHRFFQIVGDDGRGMPITEWNGGKGKISINLGKSEGISISAGILFCHHKESLKEMLKKAHTLLDRTAKDSGGRDCLAVELYKRSGGSRTICRKWDDNAWKAFEDVCIALRDTEKQKELSRSLMYRLNEFKPALEAIIKAQTDVDKRLEDFIAAQIDRSEIKSTKIDQLAKSIVSVIWNRCDTSSPIQTENLVIASFLAEKGE